jgi:hypothetical protein
MLSVLPENINYLLTGDYDNLVGPDGYTFLEID